MRDPVSHGLELLANGLRPYAADRAVAARIAGADAAETALTDAQAILLFMWDHWNEAFRTELSFVERSLISELREFRNRWAHQIPFSEQDVYRFLDDVERLLVAVKSPQAAGVRELRRNSLRRLYEAEGVAASREKPFRRWWPLGVCLACAVAINFAVLYYIINTVTVTMGLLVCLLLGRVGFVLANRERIPRVGPRECSGCNRIIYTAECPYCETPSPLKLRESDSQLIGNMPVST